MPRILQLDTSRKGSYRRAPGRDRKDPEEQLNLFVARAANVVRLDAGLSPFDAALMLDRTGGDSRGAYLNAVKHGDRVADAYCNLGILEGGRWRV